MKVSLGRLGVLTTAAALLAVVATAPAGAQTAAPAPCPGAVVLKDPKGDQEYTRAYALGLAQTTVAAPASYDVTQIFLTLDEVAGKKQLRANLVIDNLTAEQIDEVWANDARYSVEMNFGGTFVRATAIQKDGQWSYIYSSNAVATPEESPIQQRRYLSDTATTGSTVPGPSGVVSIDVPDAALPGLKAGDKIDATGYTWAHTGTQVGGSRVDDAPDDRSMKTFTLMECAPATTTPNTTNTGTEPNTPNAGNMPNQSGTNPGTTSGGESETTTKKPKKAKKCKKARGKAKGHAKKGAKKCPKPKKGKKKAKKRN